MSCLCCLLEVRWQDKYWDPMNFEWTMAIEWIHSLAPTNYPCSYGQTHQETILFSSLRNQSLTFTQKPTQKPSPYPHLKTRRLILTQKPVSSSSLKDKSSHPHPETIFLFSPKRQSPHQEVSLLNLILKPVSLISSRNQSPYPHPKPSLLNLIQKSVSLSSSRSWVSLFLSRSQSP